MCFDRVEVLGVDLECYRMSFKCSRVGWQFSRMGRKCSFKVRWKCSVFSKSYW